MSVAKDIQKSDAVDMRIGVEQTVWIDRVSDYLSDWISPILVKETRQSMKSRQFVWTFFLLLLAVVVWTLAGLTLTNRNDQLIAAGPDLLMGYLVILGFPLALVIPFGAYRSLAREFEDGTIQLVSVTTMKAWQIVAGKLGSSLLQMLVYVSVLAPCIAFTYLLRGLSIPQIGVALLVCVSGSIMLCCFALFFAGLSKTRIFGVTMSVLLVVANIGVYILWISFSGALAFGELIFMTQEGGLLVTSGVLSLILSTGLLLFSATTALISFEADNRSTIVRFMMLVQQTLLFAFAIGLFSYVMQPDMICVLTFITGHYWLIMGLVMIGESPNLSSRVRRAIPDNSFMKSVVSFILPGPGRGLVFAIINIWFCGVFFYLLVLLGYHWLPEPSNDQASIGRMIREPLNSVNYLQHLLGVGFCCVYPSFFLAMVYLVCTAIRRVYTVTSVHTVMIGIMSVAMITGSSLLYHYNAFDWGMRDEYSVDQVLNWYWTTTEIVFNGNTGLVPAMALIPAILMGAVTLVAIAIASRELIVEKSAVPERVQWDIQEQKKNVKPFQGETIEDIFNEMEQGEDAD